MRIKTTRRTIIVAAVFALVSAFAVGAFAAVQNFAPGRVDGLVKVGPIASDNGFPTYYKDSHGIRLEPCLTVADTHCPLAAPAAPGYNPNLPVVFPTNFPTEFFYQLAKADFTLTDGTRLIVDLNLEGGFLNPAVVNPGDQVVFSRIRIRDRALLDGTYRITHPYGVDTIVADPAKGVNFTEDVAPIPGGFGAALNGRVGPFLTWDPAFAPPAPDGYIGDPATLHEVTGSPLGTNFIKIEKLAADGVTWQAMGTETQFSLQGRKAINAGVDVDGAVYQTGTDGKGFVDVYANSDAAQAIQVNANAALSTNTTPMVGQDGRYYARIALAAPVPPGTQIEVDNLSDKPVTKKLVNLVDQITVTKAAYDISTQTLDVSATSSDAGPAPATPPVLTVARFGDLTAGVGSFTGLVAPPMTITITSDRGGSVTVPIVPSGNGFLPGLPVAAIAALPATMELGQTLNLDGSGSTGDITSYDWTVTGPSPTTIVGQGIAHATWTPAPTDQVGDYTVSLVVTGPGGSSVQVSAVVKVVAPINLKADAGKDQTVQRGTKVTLNASASTGWTGLTWTQLSGTPVTLSSTTATSPTFTFPLMKLPVGPVGHVNTGYVVNNSPLVFQVTAVNSAKPGASSTAKVTITPLAESFTGLRARFRAGVDWRITGSSSIAAAQTIAMVLGANPATGKFIGQGNTDATGAFAFKGAATPVPPAGSVVTLVSATGGTVTIAVTN